MVSDKQLTTFYSFWQAQLARFYGVWQTQLGTFCGFLTVSFNGGHICFQNWIIFLNIHKIYTGNFCKAGGTYGLSWVLRYDLQVNPTFMFICTFSLHTVTQLSCLFGPSLYILQLNFHVYLYILSIYCESTFMFIWTFSLHTVSQLSCLFVPSLYILWLNFHVYLYILSIYCDSTWNVRQRKFSHKKMSHSFQRES